MNVKFNEQVYQSSVLNRTSEPSRHTNSQLQQLEIEITIRGESASNELRSLIEKAKMKPDGSVEEAATSIDAQGNEIAKWRVGNHSYRYSNGIPLFTHTITLNEMEELVIEFLTVDGLELEPYEYNERFGLVNDHLEIEAKALLTQSQHNDLHNIMLNQDSVQVTRHGINNIPVNMRFGAMYWSPNDDGFKHEIILFEADDRNNKTRKLFQWMSSVRNQAAKNKVVITSLLELLQQKGVLTHEEIESLFPNDENVMWEAIRDFYRVEDIDQID